jgi:TatA/E family protein of Tat protein translocase
MTGLLSPVHLALLALVVLLVFGGRRLPQLGRLTGTAIRRRVLGQAPPAPGAQPALEAASDPPAVTDVVVAQARQHALRTVLRGVPGPVGWIARLLVR